MLYRLRLEWADSESRSGRREEIHEFVDARKLLGLLRRIQETPHRPLIAASVEALARPRWEPVTIGFVEWRAAQRDRRDLLKEQHVRRMAGKGGVR